MGLSHRFALGLFFLGCFSARVESSSLLIIDSAQENSYRLQPFIELAQSVGFQPTYEPIASLIDEKISEKNIDEYDAIFFVICPQLLATFEKSPVSVRFRELVDYAHSLPNKLIGIAVPAFAKNETYAQACFELCGLTNPNARISQDYISLCEKFISVPMQKRQRSYHTSLLPPHESREQFDEHAMDQKNPLSTSFVPSTLETLLPFGVYYYDSYNKNHHYLTSETLLNGLGVHEECKLVPWLPEERKKLFIALQQSLAELYESYCEKKETSDEQRLIPYQRSPMLPSYVAKACDAKIKGSKSKTAWFDLELFYDETQSSKQQELVDALLEARLTYVWLSISPNVYYSPHALKADKKDEFLVALSRFTKLLSQRSAAIKKPLPKMLVGFEIANNLYGENKPPLPAHDLYGITYNDVPNPLDQAFWDNEVVTPLKAFMNDYSKRSVSHGIPMSGVMIDLEMYGRKTTGSFLSTMVDKEAESDSLSGYFADARSKACGIGEHMRKNIRRLLPNALIGCYAPSLDSSWFYTGFYQGLSTLSQPLFVCTFNSTSAVHKQWFKQQGIPLHHSSVVMLSKISSPADFSSIKQIKASHDGIWFNRFSRIIDKHEKEAWYALEQTPLPEHERKKLISEIAK